MIYSYTLEIINNTAETIINGTIKNGSDPYFMVANDSVLLMLEQMLDEFTTEFNNELLVECDVNTIRDLVQRTAAIISNLEYISNIYTKWNIIKFINLMNVVYNTLKEKLKDTVLSSNNDFIVVNIDGQNTKNHSISIGLFNKLLSPFQKAINTLGSITKGSDVYTDLQLCGIGIGSVELFLKTSARQAILDTHVSVAIDSLNEILNHDIHNLEEYKSFLIEKYIKSLKDVSLFTSEIINNDVTFTISSTNSITKEDNEKIVLSKNHVMPYQDIFDDILDNTEEITEDRIFIGTIDGIRLQGKQVWIKSDSTIATNYPEDMQEQLLNLLQSQNKASFNVEVLTYLKSRKKTVYTLKGIDDADYS